MSLVWGSGLGAFLGGVFSFGRFPCFLRCTGQISRKTAIQRSSITLSNLMMIMNCDALENISQKEWAFEVGLKFGWLKLKGLTSPT